jgi:hypothetical protein
MSRPRLCSCSRWVLWPITFGSALLFAWAALVLPSRSGTALGGLAALLAAAHALTLGVALLQPSWLRATLRLVACFSLLAGGTFLGAITWTSVVLVQQFGSLGWGVSALLGAIAILLAALTCPFAIWGLWVTRNQHAEE